MKRSSSASDARLPITLDILKSVLSNLHMVCSSIYETFLFKAAFSLAFYAMLRIGEFAVSKGNSVDRILQIGDIPLQTNHLTIRIRYSKTDQFGIGTTLSVQKSVGVICPLQTLHDYLQVRPLKPGPLFCHFAGHPITRYQFNTILTRSLRLAGIDSRHFKSHSFRIGAATTLAHQGGLLVISYTKRWPLEICCISVSLMLVVCMSNINQVLHRANASMNR
jgi:integrase